MKLVAIAALVAAQVMVSSGPLRAAELVSETSGSAQQKSSVGAFAGARVRVPLGVKQAKVRGGLVVASLVQGRRVDGSIRTRFGEGMELNLAGAKGPEVTLAGKRVSQLAQGQKGPEGAKSGVSTLGWVAIGVGVVVVVGVGVLGWLVHEANQNTE